MLIKYTGIINIQENKALVRRSRIVMMPLKSAHDFHIHLIWSKGDTVKFWISMSHNFSSDFDINCPTFCSSSRTNSYPIQLILCTFLDTICIHLPIRMNQV